jgi:hemoglobin
MNKTLMALALTASALLSGSVLAQTPPATAATANTVLYQALGQKPGITALMDDFVNRLVVDSRIGPMFKNTKLPNLKEQLTDQICVVSGGPCKYEGDTMKASHADLGVTKANFNALVEVLQQAMDAKGIPFKSQNELLALLAPMHRDIITK